MSKLQSAAFSSFFLEWVQKTFREKTVCKGCELVQEVLLKLQGPLQMANLVQRHSYIQLLYNIQHIVWSIDIWYMHCIFSINVVSCMQFLSVLPLRPGRTQRRWWRGPTIWFLCCTRFPSVHQTVLQTDDVCWGMLRDMDGCGGALIWFNLHFLISIWANACAFMSRAQKTVFHHCLAWLRFFE